MVMSATQAPASPRPTPPVIGIDVGQDCLAIAVAPSGEQWTSRTSLAALGRLAARLAELAPGLVVLEASGGYEQPVVAALHAADVPVAIVNPRRVRAFATATGQRAKTDPIDAAVLARFGQTISPRPTPPPSTEQARLRALVRRREQVVALASAERQRRRQARADADLLAWIDQVLAVLHAQRQELEARIAALLAADQQWQALAARLTSMPGVGPLVSATLIAELPELGQADDKAIAALAGLAPYSRDSGRWRGRRRIGGGRAPVRRMLYLAVISARQHNPTIKTLYERLRAAGKPVKVVIIACARKLLTILNVMVATNTDFRRESPAGA